MVSEVEYYMHNHLKQEIYDSCKDVVNPATGKPALELMCGVFGASCTPELFFDALGKIPPSGYAPFRIKYSFANGTTENGFEPLDKESVRSCDQPIPVSISYLKFSIREKV